MMQCISSNENISGTIEALHIYTYIDIRSRPNYVPPLHPYIPTWSQSLQEKGKSGRRRDGPSIYPLLLSLTYLPTTCSPPFPSSTIPTALLRRYLCTSFFSLLIPHFTLLASRLSYSKPSTLPFHAPPFVFFQTTTTTTSTTATTTNIAAHRLPATRTAQEPVARNPLPIRRHGLLVRQKQPAFGCRLSDNGASRIAQSARPRQG
ncbi:uncharacterized protein J3D65DRAFT_454513 [Phyllosticta citribraziliensis]|uniref:Uncharacterized protein n=1 Tax=Phyllosticta citribraziliensis TaxID=989973 RepID=A0ABR1LEW6_9PEZI